MSQSVSATRALEPKESAPAKGRSGLLRGREWYRVGTGSAGDACRRLADRLLLMQALLALARARNPLQVVDSDGFTHAQAVYGVNQTGL